MILCMTCGFCFVFCFVFFFLPLFPVAVSGYFPNFFVFVYCIVLYNCYWISSKFSIMIAVTGIAEGLPPLPHPPPPKREKKALLAKPLVGSMNMKFDI